jgi:16S rRNA (guanine1516-N2)-methyltransferase
VNPSVTVTTSLRDLPWADRLEKVVQCAGILFEDAESPWVVDVVDQRLELRRYEEARGRGLSIDYSDVLATLTTADPLIRSMGGFTSVIDCTAGMGFDAFSLAASGCQVVAIERAAAPLLLAIDALARAEQTELFQERFRGRLAFQFGDAKSLLSTIERPEVVILDPMFPPKRKASALPPRRIQVLRELVGADPDAEELLAAALRSAMRRVVVKRSDDGPAMTVANRSPVGAIAGRTVRFDLYAPL